MTKRWLSLMMALFFVVGLAVVLPVDTAMAQKVDCNKFPNDPACQTKGEPCSPGFYKNHIDFWWGIYCDDSTNQCSSLLTALTCKGADATCGRSAAAAYLNGQSGCTE